jgi:hypothetical protein
MRSEIVVFGKEQKLETPLVLRAGNQILITAAPGSDTVTVSRFQLGSDDMRREVSTRVVDVIRTAVEFGANYPDIAQMLAQADKQHNLPGRVAIDTLPQAGRTYYRPGDLVPLGTEKGTAVGRPSMVPNMFPNLRETDGFKKKETLKNQEKRDDVDGDGDDESGSGSASLADARKRSEKPKSAAGWERFDVFHIFTNPEFIDVEPLEEGSH